MPAGGPTHLQTKKKSLPYTERGSGRRPIVPKLHDGVFSSIGSLQKKDLSKAKKKRSDLSEMSVCARAAYGGQEIPLTSEDGHQEYPCQGACTESAIACWKGAAVGKLPLDLATSPRRLRRSPWKVE